jgi:hypothetical protein
VITDPWAWMALRVMIGFCAVGGLRHRRKLAQQRGHQRDAGAVAVGLHAGADVRPGGRAGHPAAGDPSGFLLFIIPSILVSLSFAPILLSVSPTPAFEAARPMSLAQLYDASPFGVVGMTAAGRRLLGQFGMASVYATEHRAEPGATVGLRVVLLHRRDRAAIPDRLAVGPDGPARADRGGVGGARGRGGLVGSCLGHLPVLLAVGLLSGGLAQPLYALLIAYTNDYLDPRTWPPPRGG